MVSPVNKGIHYTNWHAAIQGAEPLTWRLLASLRRTRFGFSEGSDSVLENGLLIRVTIYFLWINAFLTKVLGRRYNERH